MKVLNSLIISQSTSFTLYIILLKILLKLLYNNLTYQSHPECEVLKL